MPESKIVKEVKVWTATWDSSVKRFRVRRIIHFKDGTRKLENKPHREYKDFDTDENKINEYLERENYRQAQEEKAKKEYKIRTAFIKGKSFNEDFEQWMFDRTGNETYSRNVASSVRRYLIEYFHTTKRNYDYKKWTSLDSQANFVVYLKNKKLAHKTIITIKNNINMFFQFLHEKSKGQIEVMKFTFPSLTRSGTRKYEKERKEKAKLKDKRLSGQDYITEDDFKKIYKYCTSTKPADDENRYTVIAPYVWICYHYGLRRAEAMAVRPECLRKDYLRITHQLKKISEYGELKHGAEERKVPHIFTKEKLKIVAGMLKLINETNLHPTTFTNRFSEVIEALKMSFTIHNLRNTFITNCFSIGISAIEIMYAAGHTDLRTTQKYIRDNRELKAKERVTYDDLSDFDLDKAI